MYRRDALSERDTPQVPESLYQHITSFSQWYLMSGQCQKILIVFSSFKMVFNPLYKP